MTNTVLPLVISKDVACKVFDDQVDTCLVKAIRILNAALDNFVRGKTRLFSEEELGYLNESLEIRQCLKEKIVGFYTNKGWTVQFTVTKDGDLESGYFSFS